MYIEMTTMKPQSHQHKKGKNWVYFRRSKKQEGSAEGKTQGIAAESAQKLRKKRRRKGKRIESQSLVKNDDTTLNSKKDSVKVPYKAVVKEKETCSSASSTSNLLPSQKAPESKQKRKKEKRKLRILKRKQEKGEKRPITNVQSGTSSSLNPGHSDTVNKKTKGVTLTKVLASDEGVSGPGKQDKRDPIQTKDKAADPASKKQQKQKGNKRKHKASAGESRQGSAIKRKRSEDVKEDSGMSSGAESPELPSEPQNVAANWKALMSKLKGPGSSKQKSKMKKDDAPGENKEAEIWFDDVDPALLEAEKLSSGTGEHSVTQGAGEGESEEWKNNEITKCVALDCEMVGTGYEGKESILARVSMVNEYGHCIYDKFVKPREKVTDYRTQYSGVRASDLYKGKAEEFLTVQKEVADIMKDRILVGHALKNDMKVLFLGHARSRVRDTATYPHFRELMKTKRPALRKLAKAVLGITIQEGEHSSVVDAQTTMRLYTLHRTAWEKSLKHKTRPTPKTKT